MNNKTVRNVVRTLRKHATTRMKPKEAIQGYMDIGGILNCIDTSAIREKHKHRLMYMLDDSVDDNGLLTPQTRFRFLQRASTYLRLRRLKGYDFKRLEKRIYALVLPKKNNGFEKKNYNMGDCIASAWKHMRHEWKRICAVGALLTLESVSKALKPVLIGELINDASTSQLQTSYVVYYVILFFILTATSNLTVFLKSRILSSAVGLARQKLIHKVAHADVNFNRFVGITKLRTTFDSIDTVVNLFGTFFTWIDALLTITTTFVFAYRSVSSVTVLFLLCFQPLIFCPYRFRGAHQRVPSCTKMLKSRRLLSSQTSLILASAIKVAGCQSFLEKEMWTPSRNRMVDTFRYKYGMGIYTQNFLFQIPDLASTLFTLFLLYSVSKPNSGVSVGVYYVVTTLFSKVLRPMYTIGRLSNIVFRGSTALRHLDEIIGFESGGSTHDGRQLTKPPLPPLSRCIDFRRVTFAYDNADECVIDGLSLHIEKGEFLMIAGNSGCGKSTFLSLLLQQHACRDGCIEFDGANISEYSIESFRSQIGVVFQNVMMLNGTIRENISFGEDASFEEVKRAAEQAEIAEFVSTLQDGYDTVLGSESMVRISGGQAQRITIARALCRKDLRLLIPMSHAALLIPRTV